MKLNARIKADLERMAALQTRIEQGDEEEELFVEYRKLQEPMVGAFLPLVQLLADAGLLSVDLDQDAINDVRELEQASLDVIGAFKNGSIYLVPGPIGSYVPLKHLSQLN